MADPWVVGDTVYVLSGDNVLFALDAGTGFEEWSLKLKVD